MITDYKKKIKELIKKKYIKGDDISKIYILEALNLLSRKKQTLTSAELGQILNKLSEREKEESLAGSVFYQTLPQINNYVCIFYKDLEMHFAIKFQNLQYFYYFFEMEDSFYNSYDGSGGIPDTVSYINFKSILDDFFKRVEKINYSQLMKDIISPEAHTIEEDLTIIKSYNAMLDVFEQVFNFSFLPAKINLAILQKKFLALNDSLELMIKNRNDTIQKKLRNMFPVVDFQKIGNIENNRKDRLINHILNLSQKDRREDFAFMYDYMDFLQGVENGY